mgnify:CR=1 FL=1
MAIAIIAGILAGLVSLVPMWAGVRSAKRMDAQQSAAGYLTPVLLAVGGSFVVLALATVICVVVARSSVVPFALAKACTLVVAALGYGIAKAIRK